MSASCAPSCRAAGRLSDDPSLPPLPVQGRRRAGRRLRAAARRPAPARARLAPDAVDGYLAIAPDGAVTLYAGKVDLGTGARAALRQIVADELGAAIDRITLIEGDTALRPDQGGTGGSTGIAVGGMQIRHAAATARQNFCDIAAAATATRPTTELEAIDGQVRPKSRRPRSQLRGTDR